MYRAVQKRLRAARASPASPTPSTSSTPLYLFYPFYLSPQHFWSARGIKDVPPMMALKTQGASMRPIKYAALAATVFYLSVPALAQAQGARGDRAAPRAHVERNDMARADLVSRLLERKAELKLTDEQVTRLTAIQTRYKALNQPHVDAMRASRPDSAQRDSMRKAMREQVRAERQRAMEQRAEANPEGAAHRRALMENSRKMRSEVEAVLTAEQKSKVRVRGWNPSTKEE